MPAEPDPFAAYRRGRLGRLPASPTDPHRLLSSVADALNACERAGIIVDLDHGALESRAGYVLPVGDPRLGSRWAVRMRAPSGGDEES